MKSKQKQKSETKESKRVSGALSTTNNTNYSLRGRKFEGYVVKKFENRVTIEFERVIYIRKYERYTKSKTKMHARLPIEMKDQINIGDYIQIMECRPLSKIIHFIVIKKIRDVDAKKQVEEKFKEELVK